MLKIISLLVVFLPTLAFAKGSNRLDIMGSTDLKVYQCSVHEEAGVRWFKINAPNAAVAVSSLQAALSVAYDNEIITGSDQHGADLTKIVVMCGDNR